MLNVPSKKYNYAQYGTLISDCKDIIHSMSHWCERLKCDLLGWNGLVRIQNSLQEGGGRGRGTCIRESGVGWSTLTLGSNNDFIILIISTASLDFEW